MNIKMPEKVLEQEEVEKEIDRLYESPEMQALLHSDEARDIKELLETHRDWETLQKECQGQSENVEKFLRDRTLREAKQTITRNILLLRNGLTTNAQILSRLTRDTQDAFRDLQDDTSIAITPWRDIPNTPRKWLIPNWLPANTATMFTGDGGAGKSWLTLQAICQIACGFNNAFLDPEFPIPSEPDESIEPKHVIFATYEDEPEEILRRLQALASGMNWILKSLDTIQQHLHIVDMRGIGSLWGPGMGKHIALTGDLLLAGEELRTLCEERNAKLLVMDPLSGAFGGNENDRTAVYDFVSSFRSWGDAAKCAILAIGHLPKGAEGRAAGFSGSTAWEASARSMWMLAKKQDDPKDEKSFYFSLEHTKSNYAPLQNKVYLAKSEYGWWQEVDTKEDAIAASIDYQHKMEKKGKQKGGQQYDKTDIPDF